MSGLYLPRPTERPGNPSLQTLSHIHSPGPCTPRHRDPKWLLPRGRLISNGGRATRWSGRRAPRIRAFALDSHRAANSLRSNRTARPWWKERLLFPVPHSIRLDPGGSRHSLRTQERKAASNRLVAGNLAARSGDCSQTAGGFQGHTCPPRRAHRRHTGVEHMRVWNRRLPCGCSFLPLLWKRNWQKILQN